MPKGEKAELRAEVDRLIALVQELRLGLELEDTPAADAALRGHREAWESIGYTRGWDAAMQHREETRVVDVRCPDCGKLRSDALLRGAGFALGVAAPPGDPRLPSVPVQETPDYRRQATGQQKRADRLAAALRDLHRAHGRLKRGRRKIEKRLGAMTRMRDDAIRRQVKAERACADLRRERDEAQAAQALRGEHFLDGVELRQAQDEAIREIQREAANAIESEVALKHAAVRALRAAIGAALQVLTVGGGRGVAETHLLRALREVYDPDDGGVH